MFRLLCPTVLLNFLLLAVAPVLGAAPPEIHSRLVRIDRQVQATAAGLSLGVQPHDADEVRRAETELAALAGELATATELADREALIEKVRLLRRRAAEIRAATRAAEPASPLAGRPRPTPLVRLVGGLPGNEPASPPGNDACAAALSLVLGATATGSLAEASNDGQASCGSSLFASDVWYRFDPPDSGYYSADTLGSNFDTVLSLHEGCPGTLDNQEICNDDGLGLSSALSFYGYPGSPVWLRVAGYGGDRGSYQVQVGTGGTITGILRAADTNAARPGVRVEAYGNSSFPESIATTGPDGRFTLTNLQAGFYFVWAEGIGDYLAAPYGGCPNGAETCPLRASPAVTVGSTGTVTEIDILQRRGAAVTGRVTRNTGAALAGATVIAWDPANEWQIASAETDASGNYRLAPLPTGSWTVYTSEEGVLNEAWPNVPCPDFYDCGNQGTPISVPSGGTVNGIDFVLDLLGSLSGRVTDQISGLPLSGVEVRIYTASGSWVGYDYTDDTGAYSLTGLTAGSYRAISYGPYGDPYAPELYLDRPCGQNCQISAGTPIAVALNANTPNINFTLAVRGSLTGRVTSTGGTSLPAVRVYLYSSDGYAQNSVVTDANGNYLFAGVDAGSYFLRTDNSLGWLDELFDDRPCGLSCDVRTGTPVVIQDGQTTLAHFSLGPGAAIAGTITENTTGLGLNNGSVRLWSAQGQLLRVLDQLGNGSFVFSGLAPGSYYLTTYGHPEHRDELYADLPCEGSCTVTAGTPIVLAGSGSVQRNFVLDRLGTISGFVFPEPSGPGLASWRVSLYSEAGQFLASDYTANDGSYAFPGLAAGNYRLRTEGDGPYIDELHANLPCETGCTVSAGAPVTVALGGTTAIDFHLAPFPQVHGTVRHQITGAPLNAVVHALSLSSSGGGSTPTAADGSYVLRVPPGTYGVYAVRSGFAAEIWQEVQCPLSILGPNFCHPNLGTPVTVGSVPVTGVNFTLTPTGGLSGSLTDHGTGAGIDGRVDVWTSTGAGVDSVYTGFSGVFTLSGLPPGTYYLTSSNFEGYIDELWSDLPCLGGPPAGCKVRRGTPVVVESGATTRNLHLRLERFAGTTNTGLAGQVVDALTGQPLAAVTIDVWNGFGQHQGTAVTGANGSYRLALLSGEYFVTTDNGLGYTNQVWPAIPCPGGSAYDGACSPSLGTLVAVPASSGVDFELMPPTAIFADGFESGGTSAWSQVVP